MAKAKVHELSDRAKSELASSDVIKTHDELFTTVKHFANIGDCFSVMGAAKKYHDVTGRRIKFCQTVGQPAAYYPGAVHPTVDEQGVNVCVNQRGFDMIKPLAEYQEYIHSFVPYNGQAIDLDFDVIRGKTDVALPAGLIQSWIVYAYPDLAFDVSKPWIKIPDKAPKHIVDQVKGKVLINFTERYRSHSPIDYFFLKDYAPDLIFSGTEKEHWLFCNKWQLTIPLLEAKDWLEIAHAIKESRFLLCNQSSQWNLATAMGAPRVLEVCKWAFNCHPNIGEDNFGGFYQTAIAYYFRNMYKKTSPLNK